MSVRRSVWWILASVTSVLACSGGEESASKQGSTGEGGVDASAAEEGAVRATDESDQEGDKDEASAASESMGLGNTAQLDGAVAPAKDTHDPGVDPSDASSGMAEQGDTDEGITDTGDDPAGEAEPEGSPAASGDAGGGAETDGSGGAGDGEAASSADAGAGSEVEPPSGAACTVGACLPENCASGLCYDADRCAVDAVSYWGAEWHEYGNAVAVGPDDERVLVGYAKLSNDASGNTDVVVAKFAQDGSELWSQQWGTELREIGSAGAVDADGNVFVGGYVSGAFDGELPLGETDAFITMFDAAGGQRWTRLLGTERDDSVRAIAVDPAGGIVAVGTQGSTYTDGVGQGFWIRLSTDGVASAPTAIANAGVTSVRSVAVTPSGDILVAGTTDAAFPGAIHYGEGDGYVRAYRADGTEAWTTQWGSSESDSIAGMALAADGTIYVAGTTSGSLVSYQSTAGTRKPFITHLAADGRLLWTHVYEPDSSLDIRAEALALSNNGEILLAGSVLGELVPGTEAVGADVFLARLCSDGAAVGVKQWGFGDDDWMRGVAQDSRGQIVMAGYARRDPDLGGGTRYNDAFLLTVAADN